MKLTGVFFLAISYFIVISNSNAEVNVPPHNRVPNKGYGVCTWACLEMAGKQLGISELNGITDLRDFRSKEIVRVPANVLMPNGDWSIRYVEIERRDNVTDDRTVVNQLNALDVKYEIQTAGNFEKFEILAKGTTKDSGGCIVGIVGYQLTEQKPDEKGYKHYDTLAPDSRSAHSVLLTHIDNRIVRFIDPNDITSEWIASRKWFDTHWDGSAVIVYKYSFLDKAFRYINNTFTVFEFVINNLQEGRPVRLNIFGVVIDFTKP